jgi:hypothetical protein
MGKEWLDPSPAQLSIDTPISTGHNRRRLTVKIPKTRTGSLFASLLTARRWIDVHCPR